MQGRSDMRAAIREASGEGVAARLPRLLLERSDVASQVDRLSGAVSEIRDALAEHAALLDRLLAQRREAWDAAAATTSYWLFVPSPSGYALAEWEGEERLTRGSEVVVDGESFSVAVVARSPLLDGRACAYLEPRGSRGAEPGLTAPQVPA